jgi:hypothetical protein
MVAPGAPQGPFFRLSSCRKELCTKPDELILMPPFAASFFPNFCCIKKIWRKRVGVELSGHFTSPVDRRRCIPRFSLIGTIRENTPGPLRFYFRQPIACATPAFGILNERAFFNQILNVADRRSLRTLRQFLPLLRSQLSLETIKETIQH